LVAFYDIRPGNGAGLFSEEKISKGGVIEGKSKEKRISGEAYDMNKQTIYRPIAPKSKIESGAHYLGVYGDLFLATSFSVRN